MSSIPIRNERKSTKVQVSRLFRSIGGRLLCERQMRPRLLLALHQSMDWRGRAELSGVSRCLCAYRPDSAS